MLKLLTSEESHFEKGLYIQKLQYATQFDFKRNNNICNDIY